MFSVGKAYIELIIYLRQTTTDGRTAFANEEVFFCMRLDTRNNMNHVEILKQMLVSFKIKLPISALYVVV